jgi:hypothetical protein
MHYRNQYMEQVEEYCSIREDLEYRKAVTQSVRCCKRPLAILEHYNISKM